VDSLEDERVRRQQEVKDTWSLACQ
jgi:hypothetical protein